MVDIVFPTSSAPGTRPQESAGRLINAFVEKTLTGAPSDIIVRRSPGLIRAARANTVPTVPGKFHTRGFLDCESFALWIIDDRMLRFDKNMHLVDLDKLPGTKPVTTARNIEVIIEGLDAGTYHRNMIVTESECLSFRDGQTPASLTAIPANPTSVCDFDGYFVWTYADGRVIASQLRSAVVHPGSSFNIEQGLICRRAVRFAGRLYVFGDKWTGVYRDVGGDPFPFAREVTIPRGIVGTHAVAGWETGWANELLWVGDDFIVYKLNGYTPVPVSTDDVSRDIQSAVLGGDRELIEAFVYMYGRNAFWVVSAHGKWTWEYNSVTGLWNERMSHNRADWKGMKSIRIFDQWFVGDEYTDELYSVSGTYFKEGDDPLVWQVESGIVSGFPKGMVIPRASFHMTTAVGTFESSFEPPNLSLASPDPKVQISWSLDGGYSFGQPVLRKLGGPGESHGYPSIVGSGLSRGQGIRYRLLVSDSVHVGLFGGTVEPEARGPA